MRQKSFSIEISLGNVFIWIPCRDVARIDDQGSIEIVTNKEDLIYDNNNGLVEHWNIERLLNQNDLIKGVQVGVYEIAI